METVVYRARPGSELEQALGVLRSRGIQPVLLDDPNPDLLTIFVTMGTARVRIAVHEEEAEAAARALLDWERSTEPAAKEFARQFERQLLLFLLLGAILGLVFWLVLRSS